MPTVTKPANQDTINRSALGARRAWILQTNQTAMILSLSADGYLLLEHWGAKGHSTRVEDYLPHTHANRASLTSFLDGAQQAYPVYGDPTFTEPCLCAVYGDGTRAVRLSFQKDRITDSHGRPTLELRFADLPYGLVVTHRFVVYAEHDVIARSVRLENQSVQHITIERALSAGLALPPGQHDVWTMHGQWGREFGLLQRPLLAGKFVTESRTGITSHEANPWFAVTPSGATEEGIGPTWFGALAWSGSFSITFEVERNDALSIVAGIQPFDFVWQLESGESFDTPSLICGYSEEGLGGVSRNLHSFEATEVLPENHRSTMRPVIYNSWESTTFAVRADQQMKLARRAAELGVELFVVDDGWFGERNSDRAGLGDWFVNRQKFPNGLGELIEEVHRLGMQFGIWLEPEMVNPDSDLFREHPDWIFHFDNREPTLARNQLALNFARHDVRENILGQLRKLLREHSIDFVKWDHNRPLTEVGWPSAPRERQREVWVRHVQGVYDVLATLRSEFPHLLIESCAGGGGRADLGILRLTDQVWTSDNTEASDRLHIQYGYSRAYAPRTMVNWVTDVPNAQTGRESSLEYRFHVAMQGVLGIGGDIAHWTAEEVALARKLVGQYKRVRPIVQQGIQYWLLPPKPTGPSVVQYVSESQRETVLFMYQAHELLGQGVRRVRLQGLDPACRYRRVTDEWECSGATLMAAGVPALHPHLQYHDYSGDRRSHLEHWEAVR